MGNHHSPYFALDALEALARRLPDERELTYEHAYPILNEEKDLGQPATEDIVERLYMKDYLYEVEGKFRLTDF
ncbi:hypothetical protein ACFFQF_20140 [Haladaptatus pallidirubidus]|uniref:Uncharacterized protein n=1 Tax=Haladaptatus pallidirubidus TaxID=1008152 RepID=A0AAV3UP56_9EURY|nr:hypothetical protein [Haladaptatus pallidirubidus]